MAAYMGYTNAQTYAAMRLIQADSGLAVDAMSAARELNDEEAIVAVRAAAISRFDWSHSTFAFAEYWSTFVDWCQIVEGLRMESIRTPM